MLIIGFQKTYKKKYRWTCEELPLSQGVRSVLKLVWMIRCLFSLFVFVVFVFCVSFVYVFIFFCILFLLLFFIFHFAVSICFVLLCVFVPVSVSSASGLLSYTRCCARWCACVVIAIVSW